MLLLMVAVLVEDMGKAGRQVGKDCNYKEGGMGCSLVAACF